jgi:hypothetical protein
MRSFLLPLIALLASGCGTSEVFYVDAAFTAEEATAIEHGAQLWHDADSNISFDLAFGATVSEAGHRRMIIRSTPEFLASRRTAEGDRIEEHSIFGTTRERLFLVPDGLSNEQLATVTAHELGHTLGLQHVPVEQGQAIMNSGSTALAVTAADLAEVARVAGN